MVRKLVLIAAFLGGLTASGFAQNTASLTGIVTDESQSVLPGVTVTTIEVSSGRSYAATTDDRGEYRLPSMLPGTYRVQAELSGFGTIVIEAVELLVGQNATLPLALKVASVTEAVTIVADAPLLNTRSAVVSSNIDRQQMRDLPILGRNWLEMSALSKGVTLNTGAASRAGQQRDDQFQLNLDGQQLTQNISLADFFGQPRLSREAIAEFSQSVSSYDVTQGRSVGVTVQAVSRSGTNQLQGAAWGNFRDDALNAKDHVLRRVAPFKNTQAGASLGGPIIESKLHYFGVYEYERQPGSFVVAPQAYSGQTLAVPTTIRHHQTLVRGDYQMSVRDHVSVRFTHQDSLSPNSGLASGSHPTQAVDNQRKNLNISGSWARVSGQNLFHEIKAGYTRYEFANLPPPGVPLTPAYAMPPGMPEVGPSRSIPQEWFSRTPSIRYDLTWHRGTHDFKLGGEYLARLDGADWPNQSRGIYSISGTANGQLTAAEFVRRFPLDAWNDAGRWDLSGLVASQYTQAFSNDFKIDLPRKTWAIWANDTWAMNSRLTVNLGLRWDVDWGALDPPGSADYPVLIDNGFDPRGFNGGYTSGLRDLGSVAPRGGITFKVNERLVLRGGAGLFFTFPESNAISGPQQQINNELHKVVTITINNPGRADFFQNPLGSLTAEQILATTQPTAQIPVSLRVFDPEFTNPRTLQANAGFQQQLGAVFSFDADLLYSKGMHLATDRDVNLFYDPATGYPKNPAAPPTGAGKPRPDFGTIRYFESDLESETMSLATSFTRRMRDRWQMSGVYTLAFYNRDMGSSGFGYIAGFSNPFCVSCELGRTTVFQRHTLRLSGIYEGPWGITLSGIYAFGSGNPQAVGVGAGPGNYPVGVGRPVYGTFGTNRYVTGPVSIPQTVEYPDGTTHDVHARLADGTPTSFQEGQEIPRNLLNGTPFSKLDLSLKKIVRVPGTRLRVTGMVDLFNVFDTANWTAFASTIGGPNFGRPTAADVPRTGQLAVRVDF